MKDEFVQVKDGLFQLRGKRWAPFGVNYLPGYSLKRPVIGSLHWYDPVIFDAKVIENDLSKMAEMGCTAVSIQLDCNQFCIDVWRNENLRKAQYCRLAFPEEFRRTIETFLDLCDRNSLKVDVYCVGADPLYFNEQAVQSIIVDTGFWQNPAIYSWALSWEPHFGLFHTRQLLWEKEWNKWVLDTYQDFEQAFKEWTYEASVVDGVLSSPQDHMVRKAGPWERMLTDYESFLWDLAKRHYEKVGRIIHQMAPRQLVFARTVGIVGIPETSPNEDFLFYIPIEVIEKTVDYANFEWWVEAGNIVYSKWAAKGKPVVCQEFGFNISGFRPPVMPSFNVEGLSYKQVLEKEADVFRTWYDTMLSYGVEGAMIWFWPGGPRMEESGSDFGIVEPDGTLRPVCKVIKEYGRLFKAERKAIDQSKIEWNLPTTGYYNNSWPQKYNSLRRKISSVESVSKKHIELNAGLT